MTAPHTRGVAEGVIDVEYDAHGNVTAFRPPDREAHVFTYTARDALDTYRPPATAARAGEEIEDSEHPPSGSLRRRSYRGGAALTTTLNPDTGFLESVIVEGDVSPSGLDMSTDLFIESDAGGRPTAVTTPMGDMAFAYDGPVVRREAWTAAAGRGVTGSIEREVGAAMLLDAETATIGEGPTASTLRVEYGYDADRVLTSAGDGAAGPLHDLTLETTFEGGAEVVTRVGGLATTTRATMLGELERSTTVDASGAVVFETRICERDEHGRIVEREETTRSGRGASRQITRVRYRYTYDGRGFLRSVGTATRSSPATRPGIPCSGFGPLRSSAEWSYDAAGNRRDLGVNAEDQATVGGREYDELGHLSRSRTEGAPRTYAYDVLGRLRSTSLRWATTNYDYDAAGRLVAVHPTLGSRAVEQRFVYRDDLNPIAWQRPSRRRDCESAGAPDTLFFVYASLPDTPDLAYVDECSDGSIDATWRYLADERGSVRLVIDVETGDIVQELTYDAWGVPRGNLDAQPFGYIGGIYDAETGFWHLGARDYDPTIGRWTTKDPIGFDGGYTLYLYSHGDPVNYVDPSGELAWIPFVVGALFIAGMGAAAPSDTARHPADLVGIALSLGSLGCLSGGGAAVAAAHAGRGVPLLTRGPGGRMLREALNILRGTAPAGRAALARDLLAQIEARAVGGHGARQRWERLVERVPGLVRRTRSSLMPRAACSPVHTSVALCSSVSSRASWESRAGPDFGSSCDREERAMEAFQRQDEAWQYVKSIQDGKERLLTEIAVAKALSFLATDPEYRRSFAEAPVDLLTYARTVHELFRRADILKGVLDGAITSVDDLDPFPRGA